MTNAAWPTNVAAMLASVKALKQELGQGWKVVLNVYSTHSMAHIIHSGCVSLLGLTVL